MHCGMNDSPVIVHSWLIHTVLPVNEKLAVRAKWMRWFLR